MKTELYFGRTIGTNGYVSDKHWTEFVDNTVTLRFPSGFSIMELAGQWQIVNSKEIIREKTMMITICHSDTVESKTHIDAIRTIYKGLFDQESVMLVSYEIHVEF